MLEALARILVRLGIRKVVQTPELRSLDEIEAAEAAAERGEAPSARVVRDGDQAVEPPDQTRWIRRGVFLVLLGVGWAFILWQNKFYISAPVVFVGLGYLAVLSAIVTLWRTGAAVVDETSDEESDSTWGRPLGARGELEREKKTLLKAIKEAEFDREMGKLSKADADEMITMYRARAIEVIKELDKLDGATAGTVREQIEREIKARLEIEAKTAKAADKASAEAGKKKGKKDGTKAASKGAGKAEAKAGDEAKADEAKADEAEAKDEPEAKADEPEAKADEAKADEAKADEAKADATASVVAAENTTEAKEATR